MTADLLVRGARVVPLSSFAPPTPVDVLVRDGRVAEVAPGLDARDVPVVEADGRWLAPGLWDHHVHMTQWARTVDRLDLSGTRSAAEAVGRVAERVASFTDPVVIGFGHRSAGWPVAPTVAELDLVTMERPVVLISGDGHNGWLNSAALWLLGVAPRETPLDENEWFPVFARLEDLPGDPAAEDRFMRKAVDRAAAMGVVGITDLEFGRPFDDWAERIGQGMDTLRVRAATYTETLDAVIARGLRTGDPIEGGQGLLTLGPLKVISDGSLNTRTAHCCEPYADDASNRGKLNVTTAALAELLVHARRHGLEAAVHAIGDAAVASALDAFEASGIRGGIEHAQLTRREDLGRMARLGVTASVQPAHLFDDRDVADVCWSDRADRCFLLGSMHERGVRLALGSDAPVAPLDPWLAMAAAVHRSADERAPWNPPEALTPRQALAASTNGSGTVGAGSRGDLVLLDADPLAMGDDPADTAFVAQSLRDMPVALTVVGGRITHAEPAW